MSQKPLIGHLPDTSSTPDKDDSFVNQDSINTHQQQLTAIISEHLDLAEARVDGFFDQHLSSTKSVLKRHWRNKGDIPRDLAVLPRKLFNLLKWVARRPTDTFPPSRKEKEVQALIESELLDLPGLETKLKAYCAPFEQAFEAEIEALHPALTEAQKQEFQTQLTKQLEKLSLPQEGAREALLFTLTGMLGKAVSDKVAFGSALGTGSAVATSLYVSQQSWLGVLWIKLTGVPAWVGAAGMAGGVAALLIAAPIISPLLEIGINKMRGRKVLLNLIKAARQELTEPKHDAVNLVSTTATYLQALPEVLHLLRSIKP